MDNVQQPEETITESSEAPLTIYASLADRIKSIFIDTVFLVIMMFVFASLLDSLDNPPESLRIIMFIALWLVYEPFCVAFGCTIGQAIIGLRVRRAHDHERRINLFASYVRYAIKILLGWLSFLSISFSGQRQALHDMAAGSVMLKK